MKGNAVCDVSPAIYLHLNWELVISRRYYDEDARNFAHVQDKKSQVRIATIGHGRPAFEQGYGAVSSRIKNCVQAFREDAD